MKKILCFLGMVTLIGCLFVFPSSKTKAAPEKDQSYESGTGSTTISENTRTLQSFRPGKSKLDKIQVEVIAQGGVRTINCAIKVYSDEGWSNFVSCGSQNQASDWMTFDFDDVDVTVGARYAIFLNSSGTGSYPLWKWNSSGGTYPNGYATHEATEYLNGDYNFRTWGYDPSAPAGNINTNSGNTNTNSQTGITAGNNAAPAATTSTNIKVPSELKAEDVPADKGGAIKLTWKASTTTTIDGYKIFRSENEKTGFKNVAKATKTTLTYTDNQATTGKTFYYFVRAYKGNEESASSNTVNIASVDNSTGQTETQKSGLSGIADIDTNIPLLTWYNIVGGILVLAGLSYLIYKTYLNQKK